MEPEIGVCVRRFFLFTGDLEAEPGYASLFGARTALEGMDIRFEHE